MSSTLAALAAEGHAVNVANGWWEDRDVIRATRTGEVTVAIACLGLVVYEVMEAQEAVENHERETWADATQKDTLVRELAGTFLRASDLAEGLGLPLEAAFAREVGAPLGDLSWAAWQRAAYHAHPNRAYKLDDMEPESSPWRDGPELVALALTNITRHASEAMEAARKHARWSWSQDGGAESMVRCLARVIAATMQVAHGLRLPLEGAIRAEIEANKSRGKMHGGKAA